MARSMLHEKNLPKIFLPEAANTVVFLQYRIPWKVVKDQTPFQEWCGYTHPLHFLKVFGSLSLTYVPQVKLDKIDKKVTPRIFIGYSNISKAYIIFVPEGEKIVISRRSTWWRMKNGIRMIKGIPSRKQARGQMKGTIIH